MKEQCKSCKGEGYHFTGVEHYGMKQTQECSDCEGTGEFDLAQSALVPT